MIVENGSVIIEWTPEQIQAVSSKHGLLPRPVTISRIRMIAMALLAQQKGLEDCPLSPGAARYWLSPDEFGESLLIRIPMSVQQRESLEQITGMRFEALLLSESERTRYEEQWEETEVTIGSGFQLQTTSDLSRIVHDPRVIAIPVAKDASGTVFGTGKHPATRLSFELLEAYLDGGDTVLDLGTGSGILALAAGRLGARHVDALDISEEAVEVAIHAVQMNALEDKISVRCESLDPERKKYDLVLANLLPAVLVKLAEGIHAAIADNGTLIFSGVVTERQKAITSVFERLGMQMIDHRTSEGWSGVAMFKKPKA